MNTTRTLQLILPTDKRNPSFTLYQDDREQRIHVYYGLELLQVVPNDREHVQYKLLVANLYNAGLKVGALEDLFEVDRKTMRVWGEALQSGEVQRLARALEGRQRQRKLTPEIESFIGHRFAEVYGQHRRQYNARLRQEVWEVFGVRLSGEAIRPLLGRLRGAAQSGGGAAPTEVPLEAGTAAGPVLGPGAEPALPRAGDPAGPSEAAAQSVEVTCEWVGETSLPTPPLPKLIPAVRAWASGQARWCDHLGLLLFWQALSQLGAVLSPPVPVLKQWLASVLLGALNLEQTKYLNWEDLSLLLGPVVWGPTPQRNALTELATPATVQAVWRWNAQQVGADRESDFYVDPHTKHYTGQQPILKGWCPVIRWADKALHSDFVHTRRGEAVYGECTDNFADLRERLWEMVARLRQTLGWSADKVLTLVLDRGVFGLEVFEKVRADPGLHLITWEKGYQAGPWRPELKQGEFLLQRARNRAQDLRSYRFEYLERPWPKAQEMRQLIVRATNPEGRVMEVGVLTDDPHRPPVEVLQLIFNRWLQENDFKYANKHFGINQITSYRSVPYEKLRGQLHDRQVQSGQAKALTQARLALARQQKRWLFVEEQAAAQHVRRQAVIAQWEKRLAEPTGQTLPEGAKILARLRLASQRYATHRTARRQKIQTLQEQLEANQQAAATVKKEESRLEQLIAQGMRRLDTRNKQLMDAIKVTAGNAFRQALQPFKKAYDNYRDDHDYFRRLTQAGGILRWTGEIFEVHLLPQVNYPPALRALLATHLENLNAQKPQMPDGSKRPLKFFLSDRDDFEIRLKPGP